MNHPLRIMLRFLEHTYGVEMGRNVIDHVSLMGVYDLSAEREVCRLNEWGRSWGRHTSVCGVGRSLHEYNHMAWRLIVDTWPRSSDMSGHSTQVPDVMAVDMVLKLSAMVVHYFLCHFQKDPLARVSKAMELVESVERGGCISSTDLRLTSLYLALRPL